MQYFIGLVPPDSYKQKVIEFQRKWNHHKMTEVVEPHITLKAQGGLTRIKSGWPMLKTFAVDSDLFRFP